MKTTLIRTLSAVLCVASLAVGCSSKQKNLPLGTVDTDPVRTEMKRNGSDMALAIRNKTTETVVYGWSQEPERYEMHLFAREADSLRLLDIDDERNADLDIAWEVRRDKQGNYRLKMPGVLSILFSVRFSNVMITTSGVEFDASLYGHSLGHCTLVSDLPKLNSTSFFDEPMARGLLFYATEECLLDDADDGLDGALHFSSHSNHVYNLTYDDFDEDDLEEAQEAMNEAQEAMNEAQREAQDALAEAQQELDNAMAELQEATRQLSTAVKVANLDPLFQLGKESGFSSISYEKRGDDSEPSTLTLTGGKHGAKRCTRQMDELSEKAKQMGVSYTVRHKGNHRGHCTFTAHN